MKYEYIDPKTNTVMKCEELDDIKNEQIHRLIDIYENLFRLPFCMTFSNSTTPPFIVIAQNHPYHDVAIQHEIGHIVHHDLGKDQTDEHEYKADEYAAQTLTADTVLKTLEKMKELVIESKMKDKTVILEKLDGRIQNIERCAASFA